MSVILETARLRLESWGEDAVEEIVTLQADPEVARYLDVQGRPWSREKAAQRLADWMDEHRALGLGKHRLVRRADGAFIGRAGFSQNGSAPELGYTLARAYWGQGFATEIARGLDAWYFGTRPEDRYIAYAHVENAASLRVLDKLNMIRTHVAVIFDMPHQFFEKRRSP